MAIKTLSSGVKVVDLDLHLDDRGSLVEVLRSKDGETIMGDGDHNQAWIIRQVYCVHNPVPAIRAFHVHEKLIDYFYIAKGSAIFSFVHTVNYLSFAVMECDRIVCSDRKPQMLVVPAGVWHGWKSLEDDTLMVSSASERYDAEDPDEHRCEPDRFDSDFGFDPWIVEGR